MSIWLSASITPVFETVVEPQCVVFADRLAGSERSGFRAGLHSERMFLRNLPVTGWLPAFLLHPFAVVEELLRSLPRGSTLTQIAGRLAAWFSLVDYRLHHHLLNVAREIVDRDVAERAVIAKLPVPEEAPSSRRPAQPVAARCERGNIVVGVAAGRLDGLMRPW